MRGVRAAPWAVVAVFYAAHELAHAVFDADPVLHAPFRHPTNHSGADTKKPGTNFTMKRHFRTAESDYSTLYGYSTAVRYRGSKPKPEFVQELIDNELSQLRQWARAEMQGAGQALPDQHWP